MIAISSFRPFHLCSHAIKENQTKAFQSWLTSFERIIYLGDFCPELSSCKTEFIPSIGKPSIKAMAQLASSFNGWTAIVNSDIVITEKLLQVEDKLNQLECECALSQRYDTQSRMVVDNGLDIFCGLPKVWRSVATRVPERFTLGRILWDTWTLSYFVKNYGRKCADFTPAKCVFHPKHEERVDQNIDPIEDPYLKVFRWPTTAVY